MASFLANTNIGVMQKAFYQFATTDGGAGNYFHLKTNIVKSGLQMFYIEADGYAYGNGTPILCAWTGYPYSGTDTLINIGLSNLYAGMEAHGAYQSSDGYVCLRAYTTGPYYCGFVLNSVMANPAGFGYNFKVSITAASQNTNSGNYY